MCQAYDYLSAAAFVLVGLLLALKRTGGLARPQQWALLAAPAAMAYGYASTSCPDLPALAQRHTHCKVFSVIAGPSSTHDVTLVSYLVSIDS